MNQRQQISFPLQFLLLLGMVGVFLVVGSIVVAILGSSILGVSFFQIPDALNRSANANISRLLNTLATLLSFLVPALIFAKVVSKQPLSYLGFNKRVTPKQVMLVLLITLAGMVLGGSLGMLNEQIPLPETWMKQAKMMEQAYRNTMMNMAYMAGFSDYLLSLLVVALAPAIFEEVLFRGAFQRVFVNWTRHAWAGIIITSIFFSAIHFSYFGFLPRIALGMILGLVYHYSGNLWLSILLHFLNNAIIVTQLYVVTQRGDSIEKAMDETMPVWWGAFALVALVFLFRMFRKETPPAPVSIEPGSGNPEISSDR